ncbi:MAG: Inner membrane protein YbaN [Paracidovorax wautersii]|uniref:Inner membrane protein YbaN n=1 Tax=Paracidovorax wautersii TaxID=1177982 RepID=A0A7V8JQ11_9BURK|nr:MAG: Inner membrane protein YbaN [Paracidovorax wautersii]
MQGDGPPEDRPADPPRLPVVRPVRSPVVRALLLVLAVVSLGVAALGVITPGLPSTEFVLLAAWAAARSSPCFHAWLLNHRLFGPMLVNWHNGRRVSRRAKWAASASMVACSALLLWTVPHPWAVATAIACMAGVQIWLWRRPEPPG